MSANSNSNVIGQVQLTEEYLQKSSDRARLKELMMQNVDFAKVWILYRVNLRD